MVYMTFMEPASFGIVEEAYELDLIGDSEIKSSLKANRYNLDYKYYREDFEGCSLTDGTIIPMKEFYESYRPEMEMGIDYQVGW